MESGREVGFGRKLYLALGAALGVSAYVGAVEAATINVTTAGAPVSGKCSLTQAIQAAMTNTAVGGKGGCAAGSATNVDTIVLQPNTTYQDYGAPLHIRSTGGQIVIRGTLSGGSITTTIRGRNYGYPSPNPINGGVCPWPAAVFSGGTNVTIQDLALVAQPTGSGHTGVCQYSGAMTLKNMIVGDGAEVNYFNRGGVRSYPNTSGNTRNLTIENVSVHGNYTPDIGGGLALFGNMTTVIQFSWFRTNYAGAGGGGIAWVGTGTLGIYDSDFDYNVAEDSVGGGMYLNPGSFSSWAVLSGLDVEQNAADYPGGGIYVGAFGTNMLQINGSYFAGNHHTGAVNPYTPAWNTFNPTGQTANSVYDAIWCGAGSYFTGLAVSPWTSRNPRLKGDGSCTFANF